MLSEELTKRLVDTIVAEVHPERIILFGSRARDEEKPNSDVDVLVVAERPFTSGEEYLGKVSGLRHALAKFPYDVDVLLHSRDEVEKWRGGLNHVIARALREGRSIYDAH